ncbi:hypothetical protein BH18ACT4_BH18ACT4_07460 [soil metagenome]
MVAMRFFLRLAVGALLVLVVAQVAPDAAEVTPSSATRPAAVPAAPAVDEPNDTLFGSQWGLEAIGLPDAWSAGTGDGVTVAIVDSGAVLDHPDLRDNIDAHTNGIGSQRSPANCVVGDSAGQDDDGHGTHVAGIVGAVANNDMGVAGVAPDADLMIVKVLQRACSVTGCEASGNSDDVATGIRWAVDHGADVINLSIGGTNQPVFGPAFEQALAYAWDKGVIAVVAAGNDIVVESGFSGDEQAIVVAALNESGSAALYSNGVGRAQWALSAPGGEQDNAETCQQAGSVNGILSTYLPADDNPEGFACLAGTSMAAPHVSGAAAILRGAGLSPRETVDRLLATADDLGLPGADATYGAGALNLGRAVDDLAPGATTTEPPPVTAEDGSAPADATVPPTEPVPEPTAPPPSTAPPPAGVKPPAGTDDPSFKAAPDADLAGDSNGEPGQPSGMVSLAVLLLIAVGSSNLWWLTRGAGWARRTPSGPAPPDRTAG